MPAPTPTQEAIDNTKGLLDELTPWLALEPLGYFNAMTGHMATDEELDELAKSLDALIFHAARLRAYAVARRHGYPHDLAVRSGNLLVRKIRSELGYHTTHDLSF